MFGADFRKCILFVFYFLFYSHRIQNRMHRIHKIKFGFKHIQHGVCCGPDSGEEEDAC